MRSLHVLVACEESQAVTIEFRKRGHEAYSCDLQACSGGHPEWHIMHDAVEVAYSGCWDLMVGHPPCTYLSRVAIQHNKKPGRLVAREDGIKLFLKLLNAPIPKICIENPIPQAYVTERVGRWRQVVQPWFFGDEQMKTTALWLKGLSRLNGNPENRKPKPSGYNGRGNPYYWAGELVGNSDRAKERSKTFPGIARAMACAWSEDLGNIYNL